METKSEALQIFLESDLKEARIVSKINSLLDKEMVFHSLNIPLTNELNEEIDNTFKSLGKCQRKKYESEFIIGLHEQKPKLN